MFRSDDAAPNIDKLPHPAAPLLHRIAKNGAPVVISTEPWSKETLDARAERGSHTSADDHKEFLVEEYLDFGRKGFWVLLPYELVKDEPGLRLSPLGVVPQDGRRPRLISDYSFWGLNEETQKLAPEGAMQFGTAPRRIAEDIMRSNPKFGPVYVMKNDMSDGFYRIRLTSSGSLKLAVILPKNLVPGYPQLVALPLVLPMGWTESPPLFCAYTETVADLTNIDLRRNKRFVPHPSAELAEAKDFLVEDQHETRSIPLSHENRLYKQPIHKVEVFVDDFIGIGQDHPQNPLSNQRAALSHNIDKIFRPNRPSDSQYRKEPQSQSKMEKGDASWHTMKEALGWNWGGKSKTLQLKPKRAMKAIALVNEVINSKRVALKTWQQVIGVLRSLQPGLTGSEGQFSLLQEALTEAQRRPRDHRVRVTGERKQQLELLLDYLQSHEKRPALLEELVPGEDVHVGTVDAAKAGRGGVWFTEDGRAIVWRAPYSPEVQAQVISESNPTGTLTNSDLELEGTVLHHWLLGKVAPVAGETTYTGCDNTPTVSWRTKGSSTSRAARARLLRLVAGLRRKQRAHHRIGHLAGELNGMGDDASHHLLGTVPSARRAQLLDDISALGHDIQHGVCPSRVAKARATWTTWCDYCRTINVSPELTEVDDPLFVILLYGKQYREGKITKNKVRARTAEDAMRQVGQAFSLLGLLDPRMDKSGAKLDIRATRLVACWKKMDGGSTRRRPLPMELIRYSKTLANQPDATKATKAMQRLLMLGVFFLLRPGEYLSKGQQHEPFKLKQLFFRVGETEFRGDNIPLTLLRNNLDSLTFAGLQFDMQKNGVPDEKIGLGRSKQRVGTDPVKILAAIALELRLHPETTGDTPIYTYYDSYGLSRKITDRMMTSFLQALSLVVPTDQPATIGALRCTGATILLEGGIPTDLIKLLGRWRSDEVFRYLHTQSEPMMQKLTDALADRVN